MNVKVALDLYDSARKVYLKIAIDVTTSNLVSKLKLAEKA